MLRYLEYKNHLQENSLNVQRNSGLVKLLGLLLPGCYEKKLYRKKFIKKA